jgi:hypothetical protein
MGQGHMISEAANPVLRSMAGWRRTLWLTMLVAASVAFSLGFACAVPFAAFAAVAALTVTRRDGVLFMAAVWLVNQVVGFTVLNYPWTASTLAWGVALGVVAILAAVAARSIVERLHRHGIIVLPLAAFVGSFIAYEGGLFVVAATLLGGTEDFTAAIVTWILEINTAAFAGLLVLHRLAIVGGLATAAAVPWRFAGRHPSAA